MLISRFFSEVVLSRGRGNGTEDLKTRVIRNAKCCRLCTKVEWCVSYADCLVLMDDVSICNDSTLLETSAARRQFVFETTVVHTAQTTINSVKVTST